MTDRPMREEPWFAAHCELQDAATKFLEALKQQGQARNAAESAMRDAPAAVSLELARFLQEFETQVDDERRATVIHLGGALLALHEIMETGAFGHD